MAGFYPPEPNPQPGPPRADRAAASTADASLQGPGKFALPVGGESHYQRELEAICGPRSEYGEYRILRAQLILDDDNRYDGDAVRVEIDGRPVGYLSREHAKQYRRSLASSGHPRINAFCQAKIRGGWDRGDADRGHYGVYLDVPMDP